MIDKLDLNYANYIFSDNVLELTNKNIIFGYNGSGKTSIVKTIENKYEDNSDLDLRVYTGFSRYILKNELLDTIILGEENVDIKKKVDVINKKIDHLQKNLDKDNDNSLAYKNNDIRIRIKDKENSIKDIESEVAKKIKNERTYVVGTSFFRTNLEKYIDQRSELNKEEFNKFNNAIIDDSKLSGFEKIDFGKSLPDLNRYYNAVKNIVNTSLKPSIALSELTNNVDKQNFARKGMEIHSRIDNEKCAFCGNVISKKRWDELDNFFSNKTTNLVNRIKNGISQISIEINEIDKIKLIDVKQFYLQFHDEIDELNKELSLIKEKSKNYLQMLISRLEEKKDNLFSDMNKVYPSDIKLEHFIDKYNKVCESNLNYEKNISKIKKEAKTKLIYHFVYLYLKDTDFDLRMVELSSLEKEKIKLDDDINKINDELENYLSERNSLILETRDESKAAHEINELLSYAGSRNFHLELSTNNMGKNEYKIIDKDGSERSIKTLSTGEENALGFMYFMYKLRDLGSDNLRKRLIVIDDPVNSNDVRYQSLIYGYLEGFFSNQQCPQTILLTHNVDFYKKFTSSSKYGKRNWSFIHLNKEKDGKVFIEYIDKSAKDISSKYDLLWKELKKQYDEKDAFLMWNIARRILESYTKFNSKKIIADFKDIFKGNDKYMDYAKFVAFYTELNDNSHSVLDIESSDINVEDVIEYLKKMLANISGKEGEKHFQTYWND